MCFLTSSNPIIEISALQYTTVLQYFNSLIDLRRRCQMKKLKLLLRQKSRLRRKTCELSLRTLCTTRHCKRPSPRTGLVLVHSLSGSAEQLHWSLHSTSAIVLCVGIQGVIEIWEVEQRLPWAEASEQAPCLHFVLFEGLSACYHGESLEERDLSVKHILKQRQSSSWHNPGDIYIFFFHIICHWKHNISMSVFLKIL